MKQTIYVVVGYSENNFTYLLLVTYKTLNVEVTHNAFENTNEKQIVINLYLYISCLFRDKKKVFHHKCVLEAIY